MSTEQNIAAELEKLQGMYETTEARKPESIPDDNYIATISNIKVQKSSSNKLQMITKFVILEGEYTDKPVSMFHTIDNEEGWAWCKGFLEVIGCQLPTKFADLQATLNDFVAAFEGKLRITVKEGTTKDAQGNKVPSGFKNVFCNGFVTN
jgi:hypothetical protein